MRDVPGVLDARAVLRNLAAELGRLAQMSDDVQQSPTGLAADRAPSHGARSFMVRVQSLDALSQVLRDLQGLACAAADSPVSLALLDAAFLRRHLVLQSLAERLIAGPDQDDGHDSASFQLL